MRSNHRTCSVKKVFLNILQNSQENKCARDTFLIKLQALEQLFTEHLQATASDIKDLISSFHLEVFALTRRYSVKNLVKLRENISAKVAF